MRRGRYDADAEKLIAFAETKLEAENRILAIGIFDSAARESYHAALAAARALIIQAGHKPPKTHNGARTMFGDLIREWLAFDSSLARFLAQGFEIKNATDYADGAPVSAEDAKDALVIARQFVVRARELLSQSS